MDSYETGNTRLQQIAFNDLQARDEPAHVAPFVIRCPSGCPSIGIIEVSTHLLVVRHFDRVGVLAAVFERLRAAGINVQETENIVFEGAKAALARIHMSGSPSPGVIESIRTSTDDIIEVAVLTL